MKKFLFKKNQPILLFSQKGEPLAFLNRRANVRNNYLDLPLNIGYKITPKFTVNAGPYLGYLINSSIGYVDSDTTYSTHEGSFNYGFNANVAYELKNGFVIGANYTRGTINGIGKGLSSKFTILNNVWGFQLLNFLIKKSFPKNFKKGQQNVLQTFFFDKYILKSYRFYVICVVTIFFS